MCRADAWRLQRRRPNAEEALEDPYFAGLHNPAREPVAEPISKLEFEFEKRKLSVEEARFPRPPAPSRTPPSASFLSASAYHLPRAPSD